MIDHLLRFVDEVAAQADPIAGTYWRAGTEDAPGGWRGDICVAGCRVFTETGGVREYLPYWYLWVALPAIDTGLASSPACMIVADREAAERGEPFVIQSALPADQLAQYSVEPVIEGSRYPFGAVA